MFLRVKREAYRVRPVLRPAEIGHTVEASKGSAATLVAMGVEFLLGEDIAAGLVVEMVVSTWISEGDSERERDSPRIGMKP